MKYFKESKDTGAMTPLSREEVAELLRQLPHPKAAMDALHEMGWFKMMFFALVAVEAEEEGKKEEHQAVANKTRCSSCISGEENTDTEIISQRPFLPNGITEADLRVEGLVFTTGTYHVKVAGERSPFDLDPTPAAMLLAGAKDGGVVADYDRLVYGDEDQYLREAWGFEAGNDLHQLLPLTIAEEMAARREQRARWREEEAKESWSWGAYRPRGRRQRIKGVI